MKNAFLIVVALVVMSSTARAWEYVYDGSVLPNDSSLGADKWYVGGSGGGLSRCSTDGDVLRIDSLTNSSVFFSRGASSGPITMEAMVRLASGSGLQNAMGIGTLSFSTSVTLSPSYLQVFFDYGNPPVTYWADMTTFHALRVAINAEGQSLVWLDQTLVAQGVTHIGGQGGVYFGGGDGSILGTSYFDYVACSNEFLPVPEPSSLLALGMGGIGMLGAALRRRVRARA